VSAQNQDTRQFDFAKKFDTKDACDRLVSRSGKSAGRTVERTSLRRSAIMPFGLMPIKEARGNLYNCDIQTRAFLVIPLSVCAAVSMNHVPPRLVADYNDGH